MFYGSWQFFNRDTGSRGGSYCRRAIYRVPRERMLPGPTGVSVRILFIQPEQHIPAAPLCATDENYDDVRLQRAYGMSHKSRALSLNRVVNKFKGNSGCFAARTCDVLTIRQLQIIEMPEQINVFE